MLSLSIAFSLLAATVVWLAGRRDAARDPRLSLLALGLLAFYPALLCLLPKAAVLPPAAGEASSIPGLVARWWPWLWISGMAFAALRLTVALGQLCLWRIRSTWVAQAERAAVRILPELSGPIAAGILHPVIFVPAAWKEWPAATREAVLAHECQHHRRRDPLWRAVAAAACTLHWYNPVVWWMARRLADQCEYACDEAVLAHGMEAGRYAHALCDLAAGPRCPATALAMAHRSGLEARVRRMFAPQAPFSRLRMAAMAIFTLGSAVALGVLGPAEAPPSRPSVPAEEIQLRLRANPFPG